MTLNRLQQAMWANRVQHRCLASVKDEADVDAALMAAEVFLSSQPMPEKLEEDPPTDIDAFFAHDIHNRRAQGILNRSLQAARGMSAAAKRDLASALKAGATSGEAILKFIDKYRIQLARILTSTQLASVLEGAQEVAAKVPTLTDFPGAVPPPPSLEPKAAVSLVERLEKLAPAKQAEEIYKLTASEQAYVRQAIAARQAPPVVPPTVSTRTESGAPEDIHLVTIDEAVKNLAQRNVMDRQRYDALESAARSKAFTVANVEAEETLTKIRDSLAKNVAEGADYETWRNKVLEEVDQGTFLSDAHQETVFRTNVQAAFSDGQAAVLAHPLVRGGFPYSAYDAIHDRRTRENHLAMERHGIQGTNIYRNDDPVFQMFRPPWDYSDRCGWTPITVRHAAERGIREAKEWLDTGVEPATKAHVKMPPFRPPEGFQRSILAAPLSIQLSMQPMVTFSTDAQGLEHKPAGPGGGQFTSSGLGSSSTSGGKAKERVKNILKAANEIQVTDEVVDTAEDIGRNDYDAIENSMSRDELMDFQEAMNEEEMAARDEAMESFEPDISPREVADNNDMSASDVADMAVERLRARDLNIEVPILQRRQYGADGANAILKFIKEQPQFKALSEEVQTSIISEFQEWGSEMRDELDELIDRQREYEQDNFEFDWDSTYARREYLRRFFDEHESRYTRKDVELGKWQKDRDGDGVYYFETETGRRYEVRAQPRKAYGIEAIDIQFSDESGSYNVTGSGEAMEVFSKVLPSIVAYIHKKDVPVVTFSASGGSRQKLYDRLVKSVSSIVPGYFAANHDRYGQRYYMVGKKDLKDRLFEIAEGAGLEYHPMEGISASLGISDGVWNEITPKFDTAWFTSKTWDGGLALAISEDDYPRNAAKQFLSKYDIVAAANNAEALNAAREALPEDQRHKLDRVVAILQSGGTVHHPRENPNFAINMNGEIPDPAWRAHADALDARDAWQERDQQRTAHRAYLKKFTATMRDRKLLNKVAKVAESKDRDAISVALKEYRSSLQDIYKELADVGATDAEQRAVDRVVNRSAAKVDRLVQDFIKKVRADADTEPTELVEGLMSAASDVGEILEDTISAVHDRVDEDEKADPEPPEPEEPNATGMPAGAAAFAVHWVTVGGHPEGDVKHKGGFPVELDGAGNIIKGRMAGTNVRNIGANLKRVKGGGSGRAIGQQQSGPGPSNGRAGGTVPGGPQSVGAGVAGATPRPGDAQAGGVGPGAGEPTSAQTAGDTSNLRVSRRLKLKQINRRINTYTNYFRKKGQKDVVEWMGMLKQHINEVGIDTALEALGEEPLHTGAPVGKVQYKGTAILDEEYMDKGELGFIKSYLDRSGIVYSGVNELVDRSIRTISSAPLPTEELERTEQPIRQGSVVPTQSNISNKLEESKLLPGLETTEDIHKVVGKEVTSFTPEVISKLDAKYGKGKWIVKPYGDEAFASFGVMFPQRIKEIQRASKEVIWDVGNRLKRHGYALARDENGTVVGISKGGNLYRFSSEEYESISNKNVKKLGMVAAASAPSEKGAALPTTPETNLRQNFGITLRKGADGKVTSVLDEDGNELALGSKELKELDDDIGHHIERSIDAVNSGQAQDARFLVQPAFAAVGVTEEDRAEGNTWETSNEGRVHVTTRGGKASVIPFATLANRGDGLPATFYNDDIRAMEKAVQDAIDALPESERTGQVYAPDVMRTKEGWRVVELNASMEGGQSLWLEENPFVIDAYVSHATGREPAHVRFIRNLLKDKIGVSRLPVKPRPGSTPAPQAPAPQTAPAPTAPMPTVQGKPVGLSFEDDHPRRLAGREGAGQFVKKGDVGAVRTVKFGSIKASYATYTNKKISGPSIRLNNYVQQDEHSCGFVAALTIARYFEPQVSAKNVLRIVQPVVYGGVDRRQMRKALEKLGVKTIYRTDLTIGKLKKAVERGIPVIVSVWPDEWDTDHWTIVQGFDEERVYLTNHRSLTLSDFKRQWIENWQDGSTTGAGLICIHDPGYEEDEDEEDVEDEDVEDEDEEEEEDED